MNYYAWMDDTGGFLGGQRVIVTRGKYIECEGIVTYVGNGYGCDVHLDDWNRIGGWNWIHSFGFSDIRPLRQRVQTGGPQ